MKLKTKNGLTKKQIAGGYLSPEWVLNPSLSEPYIKQCAAAGFFAYILFVRHMRQTVRDDRVRKAVGKVVQICHRHGIKLILDTDPTHWAEDLILLHPAAALWRIIPMETSAFHGRIRAEIKKHAKIASFQGILALYRVNNGAYQRMATDRSSLELQGASHNGFSLRLTLPKSYTGPVRMYAAVSESNLLDHASPKYLEAQKKLLDMYSGIPLDGLAWDEPGKGHGSLVEFRAGEGFFDFFRKVKGYDLRQKLVYLDKYDGTPEAVKVRCDYYSALSEMHFNAQRDHNEYAKKIWGDKLIFGTHQTWSGLPADLAAGVFDHFRLGRVLTGAWTDGGVNYERKIMVFMLMVADSIKKELKQRDAYYNDWAPEPSIEPLRFFNRLKTLFHVNTFTHVYSEPLEGHVNMKFPEFRRVFEADIALQDGLDAMIGGRLGDTGLAVWYGWEGYAVLPKWGARAVYTFFQNTSLLLTDTGMFGDFVSSEALATARPLKGTLAINNRPYQTVIVPYANTLPKAVYKKLIQASGKGVKVVFIGPPPEFADNGERLGFCKTIGVEHVTHADFTTAMREKGVNINPDEWEPAFFDVICPVQPVTAKAFRNAEEDIVALKAAGKDLYWMPSLDPREDLTMLISGWTKPGVEVFSRNAYYRTFSDPENPDDFVLVLAPREGMPGWGLMPECLLKSGKDRPPVKATRLRAFAKIAGKELLVGGGDWCALHFVNGDLTEYLADDGVEIEYGGENIK